MIDDLSTALEVEAARAGSTTGEATSVLDAVPPAKRKLSSRARWSWAAIALLVLIAAGALLAVQLISSGNSPGGGGGALKGKGTPVAISSATDYDPEGDGQEDPQTVQFAVDGNPGTSWSSEHYAEDNFAGTKTGPEPGVGLYVASEGLVTPKEMIVNTTTPGWDAKIFATASEPPAAIDEWGEPVGEVSDANRVQEIELTLAAPARYFLIWFNKLAPAQDEEGSYQVEIGDVKLFE